MASSIEVKINQMRAKADFLAQHVPFLEAHSFEASDEHLPPQPEDFDGNSWDWHKQNAAWIQVDVGWYNDIDFRVDGAPDKVVPLVAELRRTLGGRWDKHGTEMTFTLSRSVEVNGVTIDLSIQTSRETVCERKVVGTEEKVIPAVEAQPERVEVVEKVEWVCAPLLAGDEDSADQVTSA